MPAPQNLKNHARFHPPLHFFILPLLLLNIIFAIYLTIHRWPATKTPTSGGSSCLSSSS